MRAREQEQHTHFISGYLFFTKERRYNKIFLFSLNTPIKCEFLEAQTEVTVLGFSECSGMLKLFVILIVPFSVQLEYFITYYSKYNSNNSCKFVDLKMKILKKVISVY